MNRWDIKAKAYVLFKRGNEILVNEVREKDGVLKGYRIPGGHVEFFEHSRDTAAREIMEELGAEVKELRLLKVLENRFTYFGNQGHEIIFVYEAAFVDGAFYQQNVIMAHEDADNTSFELFWLDPYKRPEGTEIYPIGLLEILS